jgi:hypothetical protein
MEERVMTDLVNRLCSSVVSANGAILRYSALESSSAALVDHAGLQAAVFSLQSSSTALLELINGLRLEAHVLLSSAAKD